MFIPFVHSPFNTKLFTCKNIYCFDGGFKHVTVKMAVTMFYFIEVLSSYYLVLRLGDVALKQIFYLVLRSGDVVLFSAIKQILNFQKLLSWTAAIGLFQMQLGLVVLLAGNHSLHMPKLKHTKVKNLIN